MVDYVPMVTGHLAPADDLCFTYHYFIYVYLLFFLTLTVALSICSDLSQLNQISFIDTKSHLILHRNIRNIKKN